MAIAHWSETRVPCASAPILPRSGLSSKAPLPHPPHHHSLAILEEGHQLTGGRSKCGYEMLGESQAVCSCPLSSPYIPSFPFPVNRLTSPRHVWGTCAKISTTLHKSRVGVYSRAVPDELAISRAVPAVYTCTRMWSNCLVYYRAGIPTALVPLGSVDLDPRKDHLCCRKLIPRSPIQIGPPLGFNPTLI